MCQFVHKNVLTLGVYGHIIDVMKGTNAHIYDSKTIRLPFSSQEEADAFDKYIKDNCLKKGPYILSLIRKDINAKTAINQTVPSPSFPGGSPVTPPGRDEAFISQ